MKHSARRLYWARIAAGLVLGLGSGCAGVKSQGGGDGVGGHGVSVAGVGGHGVMIMRCNGLCTDFPTAPMVDPGISTSLCSAPSGAGPCVVEPEDGSLFPNNWLQPRISATGVSGPMKITLHSAMEANDLVVYSASSNWTMPKQMWIELASHVQNSPISVTVCGATGGATTTNFTIAPVGASGSMVFWAANPILADLDPSMCRPPNPITACNDAAQLKGFAVGDITTETVLTVPQVQGRTLDNAGNGSPVTCIGCHSGTPDKGFVTMVDSYPWRTATASVLGTASTISPSGASWPTITPGGTEALLQPGWGPFSFSITKDPTTNPYWQTGKRIAVGSLGYKDPLGQPDYSNGPDQNDSPHLAWINLEAPNGHVKKDGDNTNWVYVSYAPGAGIDSGNALGFIEHTGDLCGGAPCGAGMPSWSHDGSKIVYVSTNASLSGRFNIEAPNPAPNATNPAMNATQQNSNAARSPGLTNLFTVPFNGGLGGVATPVAGAATPTAEEFYPAFSADDAYITYTSVPAGQTMYANPNAELYVVASGGGTPEKLRANMPPVCTNKSSPGINNHWAKWSPEVAQFGASKYYWLIFSSNRADIPPGQSSKGRAIRISQLYLTGFSIDETGGVHSYPAIYLWNQPTNTVNTTPAWERFDLPPIPG